MTFEWGFNLLYCRQRGLMKRPLRLLLSAKLMRALVQLPGPRRTRAEQGGQRGPRVHTLPGISFQPLRVCSRVGSGGRSSGPTWVPPSALLLDGLRPGGHPSPGLRPWPSVSSGLLQGELFVDYMVSWSLPGLVVHGVRLRSTVKLWQSVWLEWGQPTVPRS